MQTIRVIAVFAAVFLVACNKAQETSSDSDSIDGVDVSALNGWSELPESGRAVVIDFVHEARALNPAWLELQRASAVASEPKEFSTALDQFTEAVEDWLPDYLSAREKLKEVDGLKNAEENLLLRLRSKDPDLNAIANEVGKVREKFSQDPAVQASLREFVLSASKIPGFGNQ